MSDEERLRGYTTDGTGLILSEAEMRQMQTEPLGSRELPAPRTWEERAIAQSGNAHQREKEAFRAGVVAGMYPLSATINMDFGQALAAMRAGKRVRRESWRPEMSLSMKGRAASFALLDCGSNLIRSLSAMAHGDILATDWMVVP